MNIHARRTITMILLFIGLQMNQVTLEAQDLSGIAETVHLETKYVFPFQELHVHSSSIVELLCRELLYCRT